MSRRPYDNSTDAALRAEMERETAPGPMIIRDDTFETRPDTTFKPRRRMSWWLVLLGLAVIGLAILVLR